MLFFVREASPRAAELAQWPRTKPDFHTYLSGIKVIKSMCKNWWCAYDSQNNPMEDPPANIAAVHKMILHE
jgi:hypothetical protein